MNALNLSSKLPSSMAIDLWKDLVDAIEEEIIDFVIPSMEMKKSLFDTDTMDRNRLLEIADLLGSPVDFSLSDSVEFLRSEVESTAFKYKHKGSLLFYESLFRMVNKPGYICLYYWTGAHLVRDMESLLLSIPSSPDGTIKHLPVSDFSLIKTNQRIDSNWKLDSGITLDYGVVRTKTKHFGFEFFIDKVVYDKNGEKRLIFPEYYSYVSTNLDKFKKVTEVQHIGCQLCVYSDISKTYDDYVNNGRISLDYAYDFYLSNDGFVPNNALLTNSRYGLGIRSITDKNISISKSFIEIQNTNQRAINLKVKKIEGFSTKIMVDVNNVNIYIGDINKYWKEHIILVPESITSFSSIQIKFEDIPNESYLIDWIKIFEFDGGEKFTTTDVEIKAISNPEASGIDSDNIKYVEFGIGNIQNLKRKNTEEGVFPTALAIKVAKMPVNMFEIWSSNSRFSFSTPYIGNMVNDVNIGISNGVNTEFSSVLDFTPIKPKNVRISYTLGNEKLTVEDDGSGNFISNYGTGTINYETGAVNFSSVGIYNKNVSLSSITNDYNFIAVEGEDELVQRSVILSYTLGDSLYKIVDNGGKFYGNGIADSDVGYNGVITINFSSVVQNVSLSYSYLVRRIPNINTKVEIEYYFTNDQFEITEIGVKDNNDNLITYATFPPIKFNSYKNHLSLGVIILKNNFTSNYEIIRSEADASILGTENDNLMIIGERKSVD